MAARAHELLGERAKVVAAREPRKLVDTPASANREDSAARKN
jgi:hypothetical protein